jgi:thiol-disulfide isomerase/thioredoxin
MALSFCQLAASAPHTGPRVAYRVPALSGGWISDEDFKGRVVILDIWATWCGPCRMVIPHLVTLHAELRDRGVAVVGLSADEPAGPETEAKVRAFVKEFGMTYPIGMMNQEAYATIARVMGFSPEEGMSIPTTLVIGRNGLVVQRYPGYFPGQEDEIRAIVAGLLAQSEPAGAP